MNPGLFSRNYHGKGGKKQTSSTGRPKGSGSNNPRAPRGEAPKTNRSTARASANQSTPRSSPRTHRQDGQKPRSISVTSASSLTPLPQSPRSRQEVKKNTANNHEKNMQNHKDVEDKLTETAPSNGTINGASNSVHVKENDDKTNITEEKQNLTQVTETTPSNGTINEANNNVNVKENDGKTNITEEKQHQTQENVPAAPKEENNIANNDVHDKKCHGDKQVDSKGQQNPTESKKTKSKCSLQ